METGGISHFVSIDILVELVVFPPVLVQLVLNIFYVLSDTVVSVVRSFLEMCQLLLQTLMDLKKINP